MKKTILSIILATSFLVSSVTAFADPYTSEEFGAPTDTYVTRAFDAYASKVFTLKNVLIYDYIEIASAHEPDARLVLYSGPEVNESTVIMSSNEGRIKYNVPVAGRYTLTWTDTWGGGWYWY